MCSGWKSRHVVPNAQVSDFSRHLMTERRSGTQSLPHDWPGEGLIDPPFTICPLRVCPVRVVVLALARDGSGKERYANRDTALVFANRPDATQDAQYVAS